MLSLCKDRCYMSTNQGLNAAKSTRRKAKSDISGSHDTVVLGGTQQDNDWNLEVDPADSRAILSKCTAIMPALKVRSCSSTSPFFRAI